MSDKNLNLGIRVSVDGAGNAVAQVQSLEKGVTSIGTAASNVTSRLAQLAAAVGVGLSVREFVQQADAMSLLDARLKNAVGSGKAFSDSQAEIYKIAQANNLGLQETTELFTKLHAPVQRLGGTTKETGAIVNSFALSMRVGGASAQAAASATLQFAQAMASGKLQGDEFRAMSEASPRFMQAMADGMGKPVEVLKQMGTEGKLTADVVGNALLKSLGQLQQEAKDIPDTVGGAMTRIKNDVLIAVNDINKQSGLTLGIASLLGTVNRELIPTLKTEVGGAFQVVREFIRDNQDGLVELWGVVKNVAVDAWGIAKAVGGVVLAVADWAIKSGAVRDALNLVRIVMAGLQDGTEFLGAAFAKVGSYLLSLGSLVEPSLAAAAKSAGDYADSIFTKFANGESASMKLKAELIDLRDKTKQAGEAMATSSLTTADNASEMKRLAGRVTGATESYTVLKPAVAQVTAAQKAANDEHAKTLANLKKLAASTAEKLLDSRDELTATHKLTKAEKDYIDVFRAVANGRVKYTEIVKNGTLAQLHANMEAERAVQKLRALADGQAEVSKWLSKRTAEQSKETDALRDGNAKMAERNALMMLGERELADRHVALLILQADEKEWQAAFEGGNAALEEQARLLRDRAGLIGQGIIAKEAKEASDAWNRTSREIGSDLTDALREAFTSGGNFFENLWGNIKRVFGNTALKLVIDPVTNYVSGVVNEAGNAAGSYISSAARSGLASMTGSTASSWAGNSALGTASAIGNYGAVYSGSAYGTGFATQQSAMLAAQEAGMTSSAGASAMGSALSYAGYAALIYAALVQGQKDYAKGMTSGQAIADENQLLGGNSGEWTPVAMNTNMFSALGFNDEWASILGGSTMVARGYHDLGLARTQHAGSVVGIDEAGVASTKYGDDSTITEHFNQNVDDALRLLGGVSTSLVRDMNSAFGKESAISALLKFAADGESNSIGQFMLNVNGQRTGYVGNGTDFAKYDDNPNAGLDQFIGDIAKATRDALTALDLPQWAKDQLAELKADANIAELSDAANAIMTLQAALQTLQGDLLPLGGVFTSVAALSSDAMMELTNFAGGLEAFAAKAGAFVASYYSQEEQAGIAAVSVLEQLKALGIDGSGLNSLADMRAMVEAQSVSTTEDRKMLNDLLDVAAAFAPVGQYMEQAIAAGNTGLTLEQLAGQAPGAAGLVTPAAADAAAATGEITTATVDLAASIDASLADSAATTVLAVADTTAAVNDLALAQSESTAVMAEGNAIAEQQGELIAAAVKSLREVILAGQLSLIKTAQDQLSLLRDWDNGGAIGTRIVQA